MISLQDNTKTFEPAPHSLKKAIYELICFKPSPYLSTAAHYSTVALRLESLLSAIAAAEKKMSKQDLLTELSAVRSLHRDSPFFVRAQDWPRGYAGDFETIEYALAGINHARPDSLGYYLEEILLKSPIVAQHTNKVAHQAGLILSKAFSSSPARILSIGCGSSADIASIEHLLEDTDSHFTLFDQDKGALEFSKNRLSSISHQCSFVEGNILKAAYRIKERFDLILIGGVFDYVPDRFIVRILSKLYEENLQKNGLLFFTNIASGNPYRIWMEYLFNWPLLERSEADLESLALQASIPASALHIEREATTLTLLAHIQKHAISL